MLNFIKKLVAYFLTIDDLSYVFYEDFDTQEQIFYYFYFDDDINK